MNTDPVRTARWAGLAAIAVVVVAVGWSGVRLADADEPTRRGAAPSPVSHPSSSSPRPSATPSSPKPTSPVPSTPPTPTASPTVSSTPTPSLETLSVPPLVGQPADEAVSVLRLIGLQPSVRTVQDDAHPPGTVLATLPAAGSSVSPDAAVVVVVASLPAGGSADGSSPPSSPPVTPTTPTPSGTSSP